MGTRPGHLEAGGRGQVAYEAHKMFLGNFTVSVFFFHPGEKKNPNPTQPVSLGHTQRAEAHTQLLTAPAGHTHTYLAVGRG